MKNIVMKVGNSLGVTVPANFVKAIGLRKGMKVEVKTIAEKGKVIYSFDGVCQLPLSEIWDKK